MSDLIPVTADDLVALDSYTSSHPIRIDLVYARADHPENMFNSAIYRTDARMWAHRMFAPIILRAAEICHDENGYMFELKDCLRTVEAQEIMRNTDIVKANPHWLEEPNRLLSPPGKGGHPRGMAIDIVLIGRDGNYIDMGTSFDHLTSDPAVNPAARSFTDLPQDVLMHRKMLEDCMMRAAQSFSLPLLPLPQEWWDFRFPYDMSNQYAPIYDRNLPADMQVTRL